MFYDKIKQIRLRKNGEFMSLKLDLHIHTTLSDGFLTPKQVIDEASKNNVSIISIADHDTIDAYDDELFSYAKTKHIKIIPAVEISTRTEKNGIHVLGYNFDLQNKELKDKLYTLRNARHIYLHKVSKKLNKLGYTTNIEELDKIKSVTKAHIALDVISNHKNKEILLKEFGHIPEKGEFIEKVMNEGCRAYVKKETITPKEAADLIKKAHGKAVLAHPVAYVHEDALKEKDILNLIKEMNIEAIEGNYIYIDKNNNKFNECPFWNSFAKKYNLISTIGSDFHNDDGLRPKIGLLNENIELSETEVEKILDYILAK